MDLLDANSPEAMRQAAKLLRAGEIVAYPTETVYGLAVDPMNQRALNRLFQAKGRAREKAILLIVGDPSQLAGVVDSISSKAQNYMNTFWPGPLSLLLPRHADLPEELAPGEITICVRCPSSRPARDFCLEFGGAITSTSANLSGQEPVRQLTDLEIPEVALGLDAGLLPPSQASTILNPETGVILRPGAITQEQLSAV
jgi:L-threonylcarbamoyladenylate synthase